MNCSFLNSYSSFAIIDNSKYFMNRIGLIELHFTIFIIPIGIFAVIAADVFTLIVVAAIVDGFFAISAAVIVVAVAVAVAVAAGVGVADVVVVVVTVNAAVIVVVVAVIVVVVAVL